MTVTAPDSRPAVVGVDGCKAGWFYWRQDESGLASGIAGSISELVESLPDFSRVAIDIPIGLIDRGESARDCDVAARKVLAARRSSVFSPPCRPVLDAKDYDQARDISQQAIGKKLSKQSYFIGPKIKEVDDFLQHNGRAVSIREVHPEVAFWALNQRQPMVFNKKQPAGYDERLAVLQQHLSEAHALIESAMQTYPRKHVLRDDIVDALVCLLVARTSADRLQTLPQAVPVDSKGLAMEIVFTEHPDNRAINPYGS